MTDESFTVKQDRLQQKTGAGQAFATTRWTNVSIPRNTLYAAANQALYLYVGEIKGDNHDRIAVSAKDNAGWAATMIGVKAEKPERIVQLFAFMSQKDYILNGEWGMNGWSLENDKAVCNEESLPMPISRTVKKKKVLLIIQWT